LKLRRPGAVHQIAVAAKFKARFGTSSLTTFAGRSGGLFKSDSSSHSGYWRGALPAHKTMADRARGNATSSVECRKMSARLADVTAAFECQKRSASLRRTPSISN